MTFEQLAVQLLSFPKNSLGTGAQEADIETAERTLGVPIRGGYRTFLTRFGWGGIADFDLYGLGAGVPPYLDLVHVTQSERSEMHLPLPRHLLPIMNNGGGDHACLDTQASPDEPPVVWWYHEDGPDQVPEPDAGDFMAWMTRLIEDRRV